MQPGRAALAAACLLCLVLGSVHAFSVFLDPLETMLGVSRGTASLTYSFALISLTTMVLLGPRIYPRLAAAPMMGLAGGIAALGALISALTPGLTGFWIGYSLLFGAANGVGYGYGLQLAAHANPGREGLAMGMVTASYAVGATIAPAGFLALLGWAGLPGAMLGLALALAVAGGGAVYLLRGSGLVLHAKKNSGDGDGVNPVQILRLWIAYGCGVFAGLMVIGHAAEIARATGGESLLWAAPTVLALLNMSGSLGAGALCDRVPGRWLLAGFGMLAALALTWLAFARAPVTALAMIGVVGFCYGGVIAATPAVIAKAHGMSEGPRIYGRVFTAWGLGGLLGPWSAGMVFDATNSYGPAIWTAACLSFISAVIWLLAPRR